MKRLIGLVLFASLFIASTVTAADYCKDGKCRADNVTKEWITHEDGSITVIFDKYAETVTGVPASGDVEVADKGKQARAKAKVRRASLLNRARKSADPEIKQAIADFEKEYRAALDKFIKRLVARLDTKVSGAKAPKQTE